VEHGFYSDPLSVEIASATGGAQLYYTTDGSEPSPDGASATAYAGPISISKTTTLRAAGFRDGYQPSETATRTYIFPAQVARQQAAPGLPSTWSGGFPADYGVDPDVVSRTLPGYGFGEALLAVPTISIVLDPADLFARTASTPIHSRTGRGRPRSS